MMFRMIFLIVLFWINIELSVSNSNENANELNKNQNVLESIHSIKNYLKENPDDSQAQFQLAIELKKIHAYESSIKILENLLKRDPENTQVKYELAKILSTVDQPSVRTLNMANQCVQKEPENEEFLQLLAHLQMRLALLDDALASYQRLATLNPDNEEYTYQISLIYHLTGQDQKANKTLDKHLQHYPKHSAGHALAGRIAFATGDLEKAQDHLEKAIEIDPNNYLAHEELGKVSLEFGKINKAVQHFEKTIQANPFRLGTTLKYVQVLARAGKTEKAKQYQKNIKILREYDDQKRFFLHHLVDEGAITEEDHTLLAKELYRLGFEKEAEDHLKAVVEMNPQASNAALTLAMQAMKRQEYEKTFHYLQKVTDPNHQNQENYYVMLGVSLYQMEKYERAHEVVQEGLKRYPHSKQLQTIQNMVSTQRGLK